MILFLENVFFTLFFEVFLAKNQENFKFRKITKFDEESILQKKRCHPFKRHLQQTWWAESMPVVADRLLIIYIVKEIDVYTIFLTF